MKEEFLQLYDYIINSGDTEKMHVLGQVTKSMMCRFIESYPQWAREYLDMLQSVKWNNYVTAKEAETIVSEMTPEPIWKKSMWESMIQSTGYPKCEEPYFNSCALYVTMCMISSDSGETLKDILNIKELDTKNSEHMFKVIYKLALDKLKDKDRKYNIRDYFKL